MSEKISFLLKDFDFAFKSPGNTYMFCVT